jgi:hypothetical protein
MCPWARADSNDVDKVDFDITKADRIFDMLLEKGHIKLTANHKMPSASTHHTNDCKVFREHIQKSIEQGRIGLEKTRRCISTEILSLRTWLQQRC